MKIKLMIKFVLLSIIFYGCVHDEFSQFRKFYSTRLESQCRIIYLPAKSGEKAKIIAIAEIAYKDILFYRSDSTYVGTIKYTASLAKDKNAMDAKIVDKAQTVRLTDFNETHEKNKFVRFINEFEVDPGEYFGRIVLTDANNKSISLYNRKVKVKNTAEELAVSSPILLNDSLEYIEPDNLVPFSQRMFKDPVYAFVKVAGIDSVQPLKIEYQLRNNQKKAFYSGEFSPEKNFETQECWITILPSNFPLGASEFVVTVEQGSRSDSSRTRIYTQYNFDNKNASQDISYLIEPMRYIMPRDAWKAMKDAEGEERIRLFDAFWKSRNPSPELEDNALLQEFFYRVEESSQRFKYGIIPGWSTDRGRTYIVYGQPDEIKTHYATNRITVYEVWEYDDLGTTFYFRDLHGTGDYRLYTGIR